MKGTSKHMKPMVEILQSQNFVLMLIKDECFAMKSKSFQQGNNYNENWVQLLIRSLWFIRTNKQKGKYMIGKKVCNKAVNLQ